MRWLCGTITQQQESLYMSGDRPKRAAPPHNQLTHSPLVRLHRDNSVRPTPDALGRWADARSRVSRMGKKLLSVQGKAVSSFPHSRLIPRRSGDKVECKFSNNSPRKSSSCANLSIKRSTRSFNFGKTHTSVQVAPTDVTAPSSSSVSFMARTIISFDGGVARVARWGSPESRSRGVRYGVAHPR